jgi:hypothetical protein
MRDWLGRGVVLTIATLVFAACSSADKASLTGTPTTTPAGTPTSCQDAITNFAEMFLKDPSPIPAASFRNREICWQSVQGAERYVVTLTVHWYANCEIWHTGGLLAKEPVTIDYDFPAEATSMDLVPPDVAYPRPKDVAFTIRAIDAADEEFLTGGFAYQLEIDYPTECGPRETQG